MLLLYRKKQREVAQIMNNLHSTMLLLYPDASFPSRSESVDLHSTMLLLYPNVYRMAYFSGPDLHSTMLLLYRQRASDPGRHCDIYIPLCFYFIRAFRLCMYSRQLHLHSTMLLLYRKARNISQPLTR